MEEKLPLEKPRPFEQLSVWEMEWNFY
jgi:hypothetical protein